MDGIVSKGPVPRGFFIVITFVHKYLGDKRHIQCLNIVYLFSNPNQNKNRLLIHLHVKTYKQIKPLAQTFTYWWPGPCYPVCRRLLVLCNRQIWRYKEH